MQCLDRCNVRDGDKVVITAGSGGVGSLGIQLAVARGASVATTCSPRNFELVKSLGATTTINYRCVVVVRCAMSPLGMVVGVGCWLCRWILVWFDCWWLAHHRVAAEIRSSTTSVQEAIGGHGYDAALDCTGEAFALLPALRSGGRVVSVLALPTGENLRQLRGFKRPISCCIPCCGGCLAACFLSWCRPSTWCCCGSKSVSGLLTIPRGSDLERLAARVTRGAVKPLIYRRFPLARAIDGVRCLEDGHAVGKIVIEVIPDA